ncbi:MAG: hypothetical protein COS88_03405 [Chloroflexi bacterium CG07_land_8_20_14_0_80_51_10]|nr:MAG: hypothetical protein COS88_03405 [Chloroflexi bacterium CG07_land_8_20_14_0_80_51_10]
MLSGFREVSLLVDTGSMYTWVKREILESLDIRAQERLRFRTIEGREVERQIGEAVVEYDGVRATTIVVFAGEEDFQVLGVHALEGLRLEVDPGTGKLKRTEVLLAI